MTEKPQPDNKTARKSTDPAYMSKLEQHMRVTSACNPILCRELEEKQLLEAASQEVAIDSRLKFKRSRGCTFSTYGGFCRRGDAPEGVSRETSCLNVDNSTSRKC